jgi:hypothetical protein
MFSSGMSFDRRLRRVCATLLAVLVGIPAFAADFGTKVAYHPNTPVQFDKFTLTYLAQRRVSSKQYPRGMVVYDFRVKSAQGEQTVSWSAGTGEIGPTFFRVGGEQFALELKHADKLGWLKDDELVVSRVP